MWIHIYPPPLLMDWEEEVQTFKDTLGLVGFFSLPDPGTSSVIGEILSSSRAFPIPILRNLVICFSWGKNSHYSRLEELFGHMPDLKGLIVREWLPLLI